MAPIRLVKKILRLYMKIFVTTILEKKNPYVTPFILIDSGHT